MAVIAIPRYWRGLATTAEWRRGPMPQLMGVLERDLSLLRAALVLSPILARMEAAAGEALVWSELDCCRRFRRACKRARNSLNRPKSL
jgi:hypothetical protein